MHAGFVITEEICRKLYGALYKLKDYEDTGLSPADVEQVNDFSQSQAHELLGKLQEERSKHSWVPVAEQLPEPEELVLLSFENFSLPMIGRYTADTDDGRHLSGRQMMMRVLLSMIYMLMPGCRCQSRIKSKIRRML